MGKIVLRRENVVKEAASEDAARGLEAEGFIRDGSAAPSPGASGVRELEEEAGRLRTELAVAAEAAAAADRRRDEAEKELESIRERLEEADGRNRALLQELAGTREQLEAAVKKNKAAGKNKEEPA